jgi:hypothetical protein
LEAKEQRSRILTFGDTFNGAGSTTLGPRSLGMYL